MCFRGCSDPWYLCDISVISLRMCFRGCSDPWYLCDISVISLWYLCAISVISLCYLCDISVLYMVSMWYVSSPWHVGFKLSVCMAAFGLYVAFGCDERCPCTTLSWHGGCGKHSKRIIIFKLVYMVTWDSSMLGIAVCPPPQAIYIFHIRTLQALKKGRNEKIIKIVFLSSTQMAQKIV